MQLARSTIADALSGLKLDVPTVLTLDGHPSLRPVAIQLDQAVNLLENHVANDRAIPTEHRQTAGEMLATARSIASTLETLARAAHLMVDGLESQLKAYDEHLGPILADRAEAARLAALAQEPAPEPDPTSILTQPFAPPEGDASPVEPEPEAPPESPLSPEGDASPKRRKGS